MSKKAAISLILGITVSVLALYLSFRNVPIFELRSYLSSINYLWVIPAIAISLFTFILRTLRWRIILESSGKIGFLNAFHPMMIGFMINCVLPGRVGELARPAILRKREGVPFAAGLATVAAERAFDIILILLFFIGVLAIVDIDPNLDMTFGDYHLNRRTLITICNGMIQLSVVLVAGMIFISIQKCRDWLNRVVLDIPSIFIFVGRPTRQKIRETLLIPLVGIIENLAAGFSLIKSPKKMILCTFLSLLIWGFSAVSYQVMALGCPGITVSFPEMIAVMIIVCFFIALPSVPGFWGIWEAGGVFALSLFGITTKDAAGYTLANHAVQVFPVIIVGLVSAVLTGINILQVSYEQK